MNSSRMKKRLLSLRVVCQGAAILILSALAGWGCGRTDSAPAPLQTVKVATALRTDSARELRLSGTIEAERTLALSFAVPGTVEEVLVQEGEAVTRGQVLARLSAGSMRDALAIAQAKADQAEDAARRLEPMHLKGTLADVKWVEVETGLRQARHTLSIAQKNLDDTKLRAPGDGIVARRSAEAGATVPPGMSVITLVQTRTVLATAPVPEMQVSRIRTGQEARIVVAALDREFQGTVREIGAVADPLTRTYPIKVAVSNPKGDLRVGMVAELRVRWDDATPAVVVPREAVRVDETGTPCVFVVGPDGTVHRRQVEVTGFLGETTALSSGVAVGERVVTSGTPMLADGLSVRVLATTAENR
jgi:membrane fusion protein (multidrug efflux system)